MNVSKLMLPFFLVILVASCAQPIKMDYLSCDYTNGRGVFLMENVFTSTPATLKKVDFLSEYLEKNIEVCGQVIQDSNGLKLLMTLVNNDNRPVQIEAKSFFHNIDGSSSEKESEWSRIMLPAMGKSDYTIQSSSYTPPAFISVQLDEGS